MKVGVIPVLLVFVAGLAVGHFSAGWIGGDKSSAAGSATANQADSVGVPMAREGTSQAELRPVMKPIGGAEFFGFIEEIGDREWRSDQSFAFAELEDRLAVSDFNALANSVLSAPMGASRETALRTLVRVHAQKDPVAVLAFVQTLETGRERDSILRTLFSSAARKDPMAAIQLGSSLRDSEERLSALGAAVSSWAARDAGAALRYVTTTADEASRPALFRDIAMRSRANHREVFDAVLANVPAGSMFQQSIYGVFANWSRTNPREAAEAVSELPGVSFVRSTALIVARQWADSAPDKKPVLDWARGLPEGEVQSSAINRIFEIWGRADASAAALEFEKLPPAQRNDAALALASGWGRTDAKAALAWADRLTDPAQKNAATVAAVSAWARSQPAEAARHVEGLPPDRRAKAMAGLVESWSARNAEDAAKWLGAQPRSPEKDDAVAVLANRIAREDPESGIGWAVGIVDAGKQRSAILQLGKEWLRSDPAKAREWISKSMLPDPVRQELLK